MAVLVRLGGAPRGSPREPPIEIRPVSDLSTPQQCMVHDCDSSSTHLFLWASQPCPLHHTPNEMCGCRPDFRLFHFPDAGVSKMASVLREIWMTAVNLRDMTSADRRVLLRPSRACICSRHFPAGEPTDECPFPTLELGYSSFMSASHIMMFVDPTQLKEDVARLLQRLVREVGQNPNCDIVIKEEPASPPQSAHARDSSAERDPLNPLRAVYDDQHQETDDPFAALSNLDKSQENIKLEPTNLKWPMPPEALMDVDENVRIVRVDRGQLIGFGSGAELALQRKRTRSEIEISEQSSSRTTELAPVGSLGSIVESTNAPGYVGCTRGAGQASGAPGAASPDTDQAKRHLGKKERCVVLSCTSSAKELKELASAAGATKRGSKKPSRPYQLFPFPEDLLMKSRWVRIINRPQEDRRGRRVLFSPDMDARVCSKHFLEGKPTLFYPAPTLALGYDTNTDELSVFDGRIKVPNVEVRVGEKRARKLRKKDVNIPEATVISVNEQISEASSAKSNAANSKGNDDDDNAKDKNETANVSKKRKKIAVDGKVADNIANSNVVVVEPPKQEDDDEKEDEEDDSADCDLDDMFDVVDDSGGEIDDQAQQWLDHNLQPARSLIFPCDHCVKKFSTKEELDAHIPHHEQTDFSCPTCERKFLLYDEFDKHCRTDGCNKDNKCPFCLIILESLEILEAHTIRHRFRLRDCLTCGKSFLSNRQRNVHVKAVHGGMEACKFCTKTVKKRESLREHILSNHSTDSPHVCEKCGATFKTHKTLSGHMFNSHRGGAQKKRAHKIKNKKMCQYCGKLFISPTEHAAHERYHRGETPFKCQICGRGFHAKPNLKVHILTHTGEKSHVCDICGKAFTARCNMRVHRKSTHFGIKRRKRSKSGDDAEQAPSSTNSVNSSSRSVPKSRDNVAHGMNNMNVSETSRDQMHHDNMNRNDFPHDMSRMGNIPSMSRDNMGHEMSLLLRDGIAHDLSRLPRDNDNMPHSMARDLALAQVPSMSRMQLSGLDLMARAAGIGMDSVQQLHGLRSSRFSN